MDPKQAPRPTLLLVDDDHVLRSRLAQALEDRDLEVLKAESLAAARAWLKTHVCHMAVIDARLPDGLGLELIEDVLRAAPTCQIAILTGYGSMALAVEALKRGATQVVPKPVDADELLAHFGKNSPKDLEAPTTLRAPSLARAEWEHINRVLGDCRSNISEAARRLNIHRRSLQRKLQKYPPSV